jgi:hypothetical protein
MPDEYIPRKAALKAIYTSTAPALEVKAMPAADVVEVRHGRWIDKTWTTEDDWSCYNHHIVICSVCNKQFDYVINEKSNFCPSCGAKMDGGKNE